MEIYSLNSRGFTLLEMMVAMVILMVGMIGLLATIDISLQQTTKNQLREIAIGLGEEQMRTMLSVPFDKLGTFAATTTASKLYRNGSVKFPTTRESLPLGSDSSQLRITVNWLHKGVNQQHQINTVKSR